MHHEARMKGSTSVHRVPSPFHLAQQLGPLLSLMTALEPWCPCSGGLPGGTGRRCQTSLWLVAPNSPPVTPMHARVLASSSPVSNTSRVALPKGAQGRLQAHPQGAGFLQLGEPQGQPGRPLVGSQV